MATIVESSDTKADSTLSGQESSGDGTNGGATEYCIYHLWGPWDEKSVASFRDFTKLYQDCAGDSRIQIVSVAFPKGALVVDELRTQVQGFFDEVNEFVPTYYDADGKASMIFALLMPNESLGFPTTVAVDRARRVVFVAEGVGPEEWAKLRSILELP